MLPASLYELREWRKPLLRAAEGSLARDFGERLRSLQELRQSSKITQAEFVDRANRIVEDLYELEHQLSYWDHHVANADVGLQYTRFEAEIGENVQKIAQRNGIVDRAQLRQLQVDAVAGPAGAAVENGRNALDVAKQFGVDDPRLIFRLQEEAVIGPAGAAVIDGADVKDVADAHGITDPKLIRWLESFR